MPTGTDRQPRSGGAGTSSGPALDRAHLARQTLGDPALEREILALFERQLADAVERLDEAEREERRQLAHGLVGSARGIGAFALADCAADIEAGPTQKAHMERFAALAAELRAFIASMAG